MRNYLIAFVVLFGIYTSHAQLISKEEIKAVQQIINSNKIPVLNIGMFHMGYTNDATSTEYDESSKKSKAEIKEVNQLIAKFKPTIILVEDVPEDQKILEREYAKYIKDQQSKSIYDNNEIKLMAFEIGRLANTKRIYGIDHKLSYNYMLGDVIKKVQPEKYFTAAKTLQKISSFIDVDVKKIGLKKMLAIMNTNESYNALINWNADNLMYINSKDGFEGADEAAKFYQRNIRMFANINKIKMTSKDRVLIISGGTHASFFNKFMSRSYVYDIVPISKYIH